MTFELPVLPYATDAFGAFMSHETFSFHHGKHHKTYVDNLNKLAGPAGFGGASLEEIVRGSTGGLFNAAAQHYNHAFFWNSLTPSSDGMPHDALATQIDARFGSFAAFQEAFTAAALGHFGSGWAWLVKDAQGALQIVTTHDAGCPLTEAGVVPLLVVDVWEHAYYIDHRNARAAYLKAFWPHANWAFASKNYGA
jgi:Fe-Mn family superoxide dismutase